MRVLITNDDGIDSAGLRTLAQEAVAAGLEVVVAAPDRERSGSSASLSALEDDGRLLVEERTMDGLADLPAFAVGASPALIVFVAARGAFGEPPHLVFSGINHGPNTGQAVLHSGTVGAALTAVTQGIPALAISFAAADPERWETPARAAAGAIGWFVAHATDADAPFVLNVNVPDVPPGQLRGLRAAGLASFGAVQAEVGERGRGYVVTTFSEIDREPEPGSDVALLREGWATATALHGPRPSDLADLDTLDWAAAPPAPQRASRAEGG